jgi:hypothetical protein
MRKSLGPCGTPVAGEVFGEKVGHQFRRLLDLVAVEQLVLFVEGLGVVGFQAFEKGNGSGNHFGETVGHHVHSTFGSG